MESNPLMLRDFNLTIFFIVSLSKKILSLFLARLVHLPNVLCTPCMARKSIIWIVPLHTRKQSIIYMAIKYFFTYAICTQNYHNHVHGKLGRVYGRIIGIQLASIYDAIHCLFMHARPLYK
jgi:hypothetical protein